MGTRQGTAVGGDEILMLAKALVQQVDLRSNTSFRLSTKVCHFLHFDLTATRSPCSKRLCPERHKTNQGLRLRPSNLRAHAKRDTPRPSTAPPPTSSALANPLVCAGLPPPPVMTPPSYPPPCQQDPSFRTNRFIQNAKNRGAFHKSHTPPPSSIVGSCMVSPSTP